MDPAPGRAALAIIASAAFSQKALRREDSPSALLLDRRDRRYGLLDLLGDGLNVMKSSIDPAYSLTIAQASSSQPTLTVMTVVACFVLIVLAYTAWSYWVFRKRVSVNDVDHDTGLLPKQIRLGENFLAGRSAGTKNGSPRAHRATRRCTRSSCARDEESMKSRRMRDLRHEDEAHRRVRPFDPRPPTPVQPEERSSRPPPWHPHRPRRHRAGPPHLLLPFTGDRRRALP